MAEIAASLVQDGDHLFLDASTTAVFIAKALKEKDIKMAVVSNKFDAAVKELCEPFFGEYIRVAIGEKPDVAKKPEPDSLYAALDALGVGAEGACYVGDSEVDIQTANNAKMDLIAVSWGFRDREELQDQGADKIIDTPLQLMQYIQ